MCVPFAPAPPLCPAVISAEATPGTGNICGAVPTVCLDPQAALVSPGSCHLPKLFERRTVQVFSILRGAQTYPLFTEAMVRMGEQCNNRPKPHWFWSLVTICFECLGSICSFTLRFWVQTLSIYDFILRSLPEKRESMEVQQRAFRN